MAAAALRRARRDAGLSQRALGNLAGIHQSAIARIETGRVEPSVPTLDALLRACGYELRLDLGAPADPHDLSLMSTTLALTPEERVDRLVTANRIGRELQDVVRRTRAPAAGV